ncbi:MAG: WYL domain-containing protein [Thermodesulfobacteriota bacterium]
MFIPLPRLILLPYWLIRSGYELLRRKKGENKDKEIAEWRKRPENPLRPEDYRIRHVAELRTAIEGEKAAYIKYAGSQGLTHRKILPEKLFRKGDYIYLKALWLKRMDHRTFRLNRIKYLKIDQKSFYE